jgi:IS5 family transposase
MSGRRLKFKRGHFTFSKGAIRRTGRNYLWFRHGDANNAVLAAVGYNFRRLVRWLRILLRQFLRALLPDRSINPA